MIGFLLKAEVYSRSRLLRICLEMVQGVAVTTIPHPHLRPLPAVEVVEGVEVRVLFLPRPLDFRRINRRERGDRREDARFNHEEHEGHKEKTKLSQSTQGTQRITLPVDIRGSLKKFNGEPTERKISELDFLSVGIPFVSRWLTIATSAYRRQPFCDPHHFFILLELAKSLESCRSMLIGYGA